MIHNIKCRIHSREKLYKCLMYDEAFSESGTLNSQMRFHTGEKPQKCSSSNKSFCNSSDLQQHEHCTCMMYAHQQKHEPCNTLLVVFYGRKREIKHWRRKREFRRFNEPGPRAPGGPESGAKNFMQEKNTKSIRTLGVGGIHCFPDPIAGRRAPKPHLCSQHFVFPVLALGGRRRELSAPRLLLNQGRSEPCYTTEIKEAG